MNDITTISLTLKDSSTNETELSKSSFNGGLDGKSTEKDSCKVTNMEKCDESKNKGLPMMPISSSMQDNQLTVLRSNKSLCSMSSEYNSHIGSSNAIGSLNAESASFALLSRRESSLENLAEDENALLNSCTSPYIDTNSTILVEKSGIPEVVNMPKKVESSRLRRTISSLLSCCTHKARRSQYSYKTDLTVGSTGYSEAIVTLDKCSNLTAHRPVANRSGEGDHISFSCIKLKKFLDIFDETDSTGKRSTQPPRLETIKPVLATVVSRETDKSDSPSKNLKMADNIQSENGGANLTRPVLLGTIKPTDQGKKCFIIDLDETLVHSSFKMVEKADFKVGVDIEGTVHTVYVLKRPHVDVFLQKMGRIFECVLFTASLAKYADPVTDFLDKWRVFRWRLFRESCVFHRGNYVKDLSMLGRHTDQVAILDNSPASYMFHPDNAVQITSWFDDPRDTALLDLIPYFEQLASAPSVPPFLSTVKPPQRATVPVSVMLTSPASISLQTVSQQQLFLNQQQQQQLSSSPITSIDSSIPDDTSVTGNSHQTSDIITNIPSQPQPHLPVTSLYIRDVDFKPPFSHSLKSLSSISSKSLPSIFALESISTPAKVSRSEADLVTVSHSVHNDAPVVESDSGNIRHNISRSLPDLPQTVFSMINDVSFSKPLLLFSRFGSRSFPCLASKRPIEESSKILNQSIGPCKSVENDPQNPISIIEKHQHFLPRSASYSFHILLSADRNHRSNSFCDARTGLRNSLISD